MKKVTSILIASFFAFTLAMPSVFADLSMIPDAMRGKVNMQNKSKEVATIQSIVGDENISDLQQTTQNETESKTYIRKIQNKLTTPQTTKAGEGIIGVEISKRSSGYVLIHRIASNSPAASANLQPLDYIYEVDGKSVKNMTVEEVVDAISGKAGTEVELTIVRKTDKFRVTVTRENIEPIFKPVLEITTPNRGEDLVTSATYLVISGRAPVEADKIEVDGYVLTKFHPGDKTFSYNIKEELGNLPALGDSVTYTAKAYNSDGEMIAKDSIKITRIAKQL